MNGTFRIRQALGIIVVAFLVLLPNRVPATPVTSEQKPASSPAEWSGKIDDLFRSIAGKDLPGAAVVVLRNGEVIHSKAYGLANIELGVPNTTRTRFHLASITKTFTALAVLRLVEQGRLSLNDPLSKYVADFVGGDKITIHHLLTHTAGLPDFISLAEASKLPRDCEPGERLNYSNIGYVALGKVIAKVTGQSYETYLRDTILAPLGMKDTGVARRQPTEKGRASGYVVGSQGALVKADYTDFGDTPEAGGLSSTAEDMALWIKGMLAGRIISAATFGKAAKPVRLNGGRVGTYGYGLTLVPFRGIKEVGHGGDISGFNTYFGIYPESKLAVVVLSNIGMWPPGPISTAGDIAHRIVQILEGERLGPEWPAVVSVPSPVLERYVGKYRLEAPPMVTAVAGEGIEVSREGEHLFATGKQGRAEIFASSENTFYSKLGPVTISFVPHQGETQADAIMTLAGVREYRLRRVP